MPVIQFSVPTDVFLKLVEVGRAAGRSEHQAAKYIMLFGLDEADQLALSLSQMVMEYAAELKRTQMRGKDRAKPIG